MVPRATSNGRSLDHPLEPGKSPRAARGGRRSEPDPASPPGPPERAGGRPGEGAIHPPPRRYAPRLPADQRALAGEAPMVAAEAAVAAQHAMTRHHERGRVAAGGRGDGA